MTDVLMPQTVAPDRAPRPRRREGRDLALLSRRTLGLVDLLDRRPELRGMSTWTEEVAESVLWSA